MGTIDAAMAVKDFVGKGPVAEVSVSTDVKGASEAAWWPSILNGLKAYGYPKNLYNITKCYFSQRTAVLSTNSIRMEKASKRVRMLLAAVRDCGTSCTTLLNFNFTRRTTAVAFSDDLIRVVRGKTACEAENFSNCELSKITAWPKSIKITFNEDKSKVMLIWKRKETKEVTVYLNNKPLEQVNTMKYLGIIIGNKFKFSEHMLRK
jgi:hypothetical protein